MDNIQHQFASYFNVNVSPEDIESFERQPNYEFIKKHITLDNMLTWYEDQVKQGQASNPYFQVMGDNAIERIESTFTARQKLTESQHLEMADLHAKNQNKFQFIASMNWKTLFLISKKLNGRKKTTIYPKSNWQ